MTKFKGGERRTAAKEMHHLYYKERYRVPSNCPTCGNPRYKKYSYDLIAKQYKCSAALVEKMICEHQKNKELDVAVK